MESSGRRKEGAEMKKHYYIGFVSIVIILFCGICNSIAENGSFGNINWSLDGNILIISGQGPMPENCSNAPWKQYERIEKIIINNGITKIGSEAFCNMGSLTEVVLPEGLLNIGTDAFNSCKSLQTINFPSTLTAIGAWAFNYCNSIETVYLPDSMERIGVYAFAHMDNLRSIRFGPEMALHEGVLYNCRLLADVILPYHMDYVPLWLFANCPSLAAVSLPDGTTEIGFHAFDGCINLRNLSIPRSVKRIDSPEIDGNTIIICRVDSFAEQWAIQNGYRTKIDKTNTLILPKVTEIGAEAFIGVSCKEVIIPEGCKIIGNHAFMNCVDLEYIKIPSSVISLPDDAFEGCRKDLIIDWQNN